MTKVKPNEPTRWEIHAVNPVTRQTLHLGYSARRTKRAILDAMGNNGPELAALVDLPYDDNEGFEWNVKRKSWIYKNWSCEFSGQTERDNKNR
jgi:hypothetical protein